MHMAVNCLSTEMSGTELYIKLDCNVCNKKPSGFYKRIGIK